MIFVRDDRFDVAYEKADEVCKELSFNSNEKVDFKEVLEVVKKKYCPQINILYGSFKEANITNNNYGAMLKTILDKETKEPKEATIIINTDRDISFQRFSLMHELGHLAIKAWNESQEFEDKIDGKFVMSAQIDYRITDIDESLLDFPYFLDEERANIFALRVLMPTEIFYKKFEELQSLEKVADYFGVQEDAVKSRIKLGA